MKQSEITSTIARSESMANLAKNLIRASKSINSNVLKNSVNDMYGSTYADLGAVINATKAALLEVGIVVIQSPAESKTGGCVNLATMLLHESGEWMEGTCSAPMPQLDPQGFGLAISYLRRYAINAMLNLFQSDDDGNSAAIARNQSGADPVATTQGAAQGVTQGTSQGQTKVKPDLAPQVKSQAVTSEGSENSQGEVIPPAVAKRVANWLNTIQNANADRLTTARDTAKETFTGMALTQIQAAIEARELVLKQAPVTQG